MRRPKRISIGCYAVQSGGRQILLRRHGRSGFKIEMRQGAISPLFKRLRDAAAVAIEACNPWPFDVPKKFDGALDLPDFLRRNK